MATTTKSSTSVKPGLWRSRRDMGRRTRDWDTATLVFQGEIVQVLTVIRYVGGLGPFAFRFRDAAVSWQASSSTLNLGTTRFTITVWGPAAGPLCDRTCICLPPTSSWPPVPPAFCGQKRDRATEFLAAGKRHRAMHGKSLHALSPATADKRWCKPEETQNNDGSMAVHSD